MTAMVTLFRWHDGALSVSWWTLLVVVAAFGALDLVLTHHRKKLLILNGVRGSQGD